jgi:hypothetical protein
MVKPDRDLFRFTPWGRGVAQAEFSGVTVAYSTRTGKSGLERITVQKILKLYPLLAGICT